MAAKVLKITYSFSGPRADFENDNLAYVEPIADTPGLRWKIWIVNDDQKKAGGIYLFDDQAAVDAFLAGPIIAEMKDDPSLSIQVFDIMEAHTTATHGPID